MHPGSRLEAVAVAVWWKHDTLPVFVAPPIEERRSWGIIAIAAQAKPSSGVFYPDVFDGAQPEGGPVSFRRNGGL
jgi:hypothetical protein